MSMRIILTGMLFGVALLSAGAVSGKTKPYFCPMHGQLMTMAMMRPGSAEYASFNEREQEQQPPQQEPPATVPCDPNDENCAPPPTHTEPKTACTPNRSNDGKAPCMCLAQHPEGCVNGHREAETQHCNSWCYKQWCHCCSS